MKKFLEKSKFILLILIIALIASIPLFYKDLDIEFDDGTHHIGRAYSTYLSLKNGENSAVLSNLTNGFGYSWNLFYGNFSTNLVLFCYFFVRNFIIAYKLALFLGLFFSGITMYMFVSKLTKNRFTGTISAILYILTPYHFTDMYIRSAFGEFLSYIFIPLVFLGLYNLFNKEKGDFWLIIGAVGLLYTHNLMTFITAIFAFIYLIFNIKKLGDKSILKKFLINFVFIILITFAFWGPLLETKSFTDYAVYEKDEMATEASVEDSALKFKDLFYTEENEKYVFEIGYVIIVLLFLPIVAIKRFWKTLNIKKEYFLFLFLGIFCTIMATKIFPWKVFGKYFTLIQFSWRMLVFTNFFLSLCCSINIQIVIKNLKFVDCMFFAIVCILSILPLNDNILLNDNITDVESWDIGYITENKKQAIVGMGKGEYLPVKANNSREYIFGKVDKIYILEGIASVTDYNKNGQTMKAKIEIGNTDKENEAIFAPTEDFSSENLNEKVALELPYIYYPGYKVTLNGEEIETFESENGFIEVELQNSGELEVSYPRHFRNEFFKNYFNYCSGFVFDLFEV